MRAILLPLSLQDIEKIIHWAQSIFTTRRVPNDTPFKTYVYCNQSKSSSSLNGKVVCEFVCNRVVRQNARSYPDTRRITKFNDIYISDLRIYDEPKELREFRKACRNRGDCSTCNRAKRGFVFGLGVPCFAKCDNIISTPPHNYIFVEEL